MDHSQFFKRLGYTKSRLSFILLYVWVTHLVYILSIFSAAEEGQVGGESGYTFIHIPQ